MHVGCSWNKVHARSQDSSLNCFVLLAIRQEQAFTQSGILQWLHYNAARVFTHSAYDRKERVPQLRLRTLVVLGGTSVRTWLAQWRALLMETFFLLSWRHLLFEKKWMTCDHTFMNFPWFVLKLFNHDLVQIFYLIAWLDILVNKYLSHERCSRVKLKY